jgi:hypothetical protein
MNTRAPSPHRAYWLRTLHQWHWISAAISLAGMVLFSITGITLNNAAWIESSPSLRTLEMVVPRNLLPATVPNASNTPVRQALNQDLEAWLDQALSIQIAGRIAEIGPDEVYVSLPEPGADAWLAIDRESGGLEYERRSRGWVAYFNDLHKGRHTGKAWSWFIDLFALSCLVFSLSGLLLMKIHAANRASTWPLLGLGALVPLLLMLLLIH